MSPGRKPTANSARAPRQGSACVPSGSKIGPGEVNSRANEPGGAAHKAAERRGGLVQGRQLGFAQHRQARQRSPAGDAGRIDAAQALGIGGRGHGRAQHARQPREQIGLAGGGLARFERVVMIVVAHSHRFRRLKLFRFLKLLRWSPAPPR